MKHLFVIAVILSVAFAKPVETDVENFECVANYLREKHMLDKSFRYFVQSETLDCLPFINELREKYINEFLNDPEINLNSSEELVDEKELDAINAKNKVCYSEKLVALNYPEIMMQLYIYKKSTKLSKKQKKKLIAPVENDAVKKINIVFTICLGDAIFGEIFDLMMMNNESEVNNIDDKKSEYCLRKYVVDNKLIDTSVYTVDMNPDNISELNFNCTDMIHDILEVMIDSLKKTFETESGKANQQIRCMSKVMRMEKAAEFLAKISIMSEVTMTTEQRSDLRAEFINFMKNIYSKMVKCINS